MVHSFSEKRAERGAVVGAGRHGHLLQLPLYRRDQARMQVPVADGGIRAHHVDVFAALDVPDQAVARALDHHRHRLVVARAEACFLADEFLRGGGGGRIHVYSCGLAGQSRRDPLRTTPISSWRAAASAQAQVSHFRNGRGVGRL